MKPASNARRLGRMAVGMAAVGALTMTGCAGDGSDDVAPTTSAPAATGTYDPALGGEVVAHYADGVHATYSASLASAEQLRAAIGTFVAEPTDATLDAAKEAWLAARPDYGLTEAFRFYGGPIDDEDGPEGQINAWPLDEAYIDYVEGDPTAGIINDTESFPELTAAALTAANEDGGETNISTGWHAIEFLLWGQDLSDTGPGTRPVTDYTSSPTAARRSAYLTTVTDQLVDDLAGVTEEWDPDGSGNFRAEFEALPTGQALTMILTGVGELSRGELAGERMLVAYEERDQENEHSCFSDNTLADIEANERGIVNVWTGSYPGGLEGPGLVELVGDVDDELAEATTGDIDAVLAEIAEIPAPFDQHLTPTADDAGPGRTAILATTELLSTQADDLIASADALGLSIEVS